MTTKPDARNCLFAWLLALLVYCAMGLLIYIAPKLMFGLLAAVVVYGLWLLARSWYKNRKIHAFLKNSEQKKTEKTSGEITHVNEHIFKPDAPAYTAAKHVEIEFCYRDASGVSHTCREKRTLNLADGYKVGDAIAIEYDKSNPAIAYSVPALGHYIYQLYR